MVWTLAGSYTMRITPFVPIHARLTAKPLRSLATFKALPSGILQVTYLQNSVFVMKHARKIIRDWEKQCLEQALKLLPATNSKLADQPFQPSYVGTSTANFSLARREHFSILKPLRNQKWWVPESNWFTGEMMCLLTIFAPRMIHFPKLKNVVL